MKPRVRFAPSPTGYLHIGGARTALYNYLFAKATGGTFILRIEDTDLERSSKEFEVLQRQDLAWLGIIHDEGPDKPNPKYAPYRQTERLDIYKEWAQKLLDKNLAYYDFCTEEELEQMKAKAEAEGRESKYEGKWRLPEFQAEALARVQRGEKPVIRFRAPEKTFVLQDKVKGEVIYPPGMVGDFVILRSNGLPVYNYCCVVDDITMDITHVIRGEDHLSNTVRQLMLYEAFQTKPPEFAHVSLLIGSDRQKLSKRHGATSVHLYKEQHYLPEALCNYLTLLGWSHPEEIDVFSKEEIISLFNLERFSSHSAIYDLVKLKWMNGEHLKRLAPEVIVLECEKLAPKDSLFHQQSREWKLSAAKLFREKVEFYSDMLAQFEQFLFITEVQKTDELKEIFSWETTPIIVTFIRDKIENYPAGFVTEAHFHEWSEELKKGLGIKGKNLFMGLRAALTGQGHGPDLKFIIPLTPIAVLKKRIQHLVGLSWN
jgi:glutamyl-tRNA synthetase